MSGPQRNELERFRYWQGQSLRSRDFRDQSGTEAQLRYWHNRALHNAYGVSFGLDVTAVRENEDDVESPLVSLHVGCGLAYDCFGRELLLTSEREMKIPPELSRLPIPLLDNTERPHARKDQVESMMLVARYKESAARCCTAVDDAARACWPAVNQALMDELELFWKETASVELKDGVPLAKVDAAEGSAPILDQSFVASRARALARPRTASGSTIPGNTPWELLEVEVLQPGQDKGDIYLGGTMRKVLIGMQTRIDTSAAGFTETPCYFAWLERQHPERAVPGFAPAFFTSIAEDSIDGFTFRLLMPQIERQVFTGTVLPAAEDDVVQDRSRFLMSLNSVAGLMPGSQVILNSESGPAVSPFNAIIGNINPETGNAQLIMPRGVAIPRAEMQLTVTSHLNESFGARFLTYAREQGLYVCWLGLQPESLKKTECPERAVTECLCR